MKNKWLNLLLVMGTMLSLTPKSKAEEKENGNSFSVNMPYNVNLEKTVDFEPKTGNRFGEVCLKPGFVWQNGDWNGEFRWNAYNSVNEGGNPSGWATTKLFLDIGYKDWKFKGGKWCIDAPDAPFKAFPMTLFLDNQKVAWGQNACFTGFDVFNNKAGLGLGIVRGDSEVSFEHMDYALVSWQKQFDKLNTSAYVAFNPDEINRAGATLSYHPTADTCLVADYIYKGKQHVYTLGGNYKIDGKHTLSLSGEVIDPLDGKRYTRLSAGLDYKITDDLSVTGAISHNLDTHDTTAGVVLRLSGDISKNIKALKTLGNKALSYSE